MIYYKYYEGGVEFTKIDAEHCNLLNELTDDLVLIGKMRYHIADNWVFTPYPEKQSVAIMAKFFQIFETAILDKFGGNRILNISPVRLIGHNIAIHKQVIDSNGLLPSKVIDIEFSPYLTTLGWGLKVSGIVKSVPEFNGKPRKTFLDNYYSHLMSTDIQAKDLLRIAFNKDCWLHQSDLTSFEWQLLLHYLDQSLIDFRGINNDNL